MRVNAAFTPSDTVTTTNASVLGSAMPGAGRIGDSVACVTSGTPNGNVIGGELRLDLRPETLRQDEIGTAFVAAEGLGVLQLGDCP